MFIFDDIRVIVVFVLGRNGAVSVIALAEEGTLLDPGPCMYMEKLAVGPDITFEKIGLQ